MALFIPSHLLLYVRGETAENREKIGSAGTSRGKAKIRGAGTPRGENTKEKGEERKIGWRENTKGKGEIRPRENSNGKGENRVA